MLPKANAGRERKNGKGKPYGIKKLRELILELAVRGKLVPQDPNDEPASVSAGRRSLRKRARLIKEGKIREAKPLPANQDDEQPYDLPDGWVWTNLFHNRRNRPQGMTRTMQMKHHLSRCSRSRKSMAHLYNTR